jgi:hypothetical protein
MGFFPGAPMSDGASPRPTPNVCSGLIRWNEQRKVWLTPKVRSGMAPRPKVVPLSVSAVTALIEDVAREGELPVSVPLPQMVDLLVDMWEDEGLFGT